VFEKKWKTFSQLLIGIHKPRITQTSLLPKRKNNILSLVIDKCLTCRDIIVLRQTCKDFQYLLHPNDINMVTFCVYGLSKTITNTNIIWEDLKYFMKQNYYSAFYEMKMFNIKENEYAVLTRMPDEKYIVWSNESIPYFFYKMLLDILDKTKQIIPLHDYHERYFENKKGNAWAIITKERNVKTSGNTNDGGDSSIVQSQLVNVKIIFSTNDSFAALLDNGTVVAWGDEDFGGKIPDEIQIQLVNVKMIASTATAFAALLGNGTIVAWGNEAYGGTIPRDIQNKMIKKR